MTTVNQMREMDHSQHFEKALDARGRVIMNSASLIMLNAQLHATLAVYKFLSEEREEKRERKRTMDKLWGEAFRNA